MKTVFTIVVTLFALILLGIQEIKAQDQVEVMVLGTFHENDPADSLSQKAIIQKLKTFNPDRVMGEFLKPSDLLSLDDELTTKKNWLKTVDYIKRHNEGVEKNSEKLINKAQASLMKSENFHKTRIDLAIRYFKNYDLGNGLYQLYILEKYKKKSFGTEELAYYNSHIGSQDSIQKAKLYRKTSEYTTIIYPLQYELGIKEIDPIDCQRYDAKWIESWRLVAYIMHYVGKIAKMDSNSEEAKIVKAIEDAKNKVYEESVAHKLSSGYGYSNSIYNAQMSDLINFYGGEAVFGVSKEYPETQVKQMMKYWQLRNEGMSENIINQIAMHKPKRVLVVVGSAHQKGIEDLLAKDKNIKIVNYNQL
ncbi:DUF5694 domain-containing protein [Flavobacterium sp. '19STA2R22 D10 B1']|uniref:DUF5694 domain-containing protein n=1 Tax=Flavobacterium aerium TaxID=3037261 RepID=UPI00278C1B7A|nr:DUF5694 domain-containing protein [Flavobacterium sp. '19STA2R22 D10 B1']